MRPCELILDVIERESFTDCASAETAHGDFTDRPIIKFTAVITAERNLQPKIADSRKDADCTWQNAGKKKRKKRGRLRSRHEQEMAQAAIEALMLNESEEKK